MGDTPVEEDESVNLPDADFSGLEENIEVQDSASAGSESSELEKYKAESNENRDKYMRALAEFENFKKRSLKERADLLRYQGERVFVDILEVVDNLELALQYSEADPKKLKEGLELIYKRFVEILGKWEVKGESGIGKEFDPSKHSALSKVPAPDSAPGTIVNELKKAYFYKDKLLRAAEVVIADAVSEPQAQVEEESVN